MESLKYMNISLEIFGSILSLIIIVYLFLNDGKKTKVGRLFILMLFCGIIMLLSDAAAWAFKGDLQQHSKIIVHVSNFMVFSLGYLHSAIFTNYIITYISSRTKTSNKILYFVYVLCAIGIITVIISQFNGMYYIIDVNNMYQRQKWFWVSQLLGVVCMLIDAGIVIYYRNKLHKYEIFLLLSFEVLPLIAMIIQMKIYGIALLNVSLTLSTVMVYLGMQMEQSKKLTESRITTMVSQIKPHFLYNSLTIIQDLCVNDSGEAEKAIIEFSRYLRLNLDSVSENKFIPFEEELECVKNYLSLEKRRFGERLEIKYEILSYNFSIPPLTLQPLVENAVQHGLMKKKSGGEITIKTQEDRKNYIIKIIDNGIGFDVPQLKKKANIGIGISNVQHRLYMLCSGSLNIESEEGKGTTATISIPKGR